MGGIFISYRREDTAGHAGRIFDRLREQFGRDKVFMDVAGIEPGVDFVEAIDRAVGSCDVLLVIIGKKWLTCTDATGQRRLDDPKDFIRLETATALRRDIRVIPVLVQDAAMPTENDLPDDLKKLARRQATEIGDTHWDSDTEQLVESLAKVLPVEQKPPRYEAPREEPATPSTVSPWQGKNRLAWIISAITAAVVALGGLLSTIESYKDTFSRFTAFLSPRQQTAPAPAPSRPEPVRQLPRESPPPAAPIEKIPEKEAAPAPKPEVRARPKPVIKIVTMPELVGQPLERAQMLLEKTGLKPGKPARKETREAREGTIVEQSPRAGTKLARGEVVEMVVAVAPPEPEMVTIPDVTGQQVREAVTILKDAGLAVASRRAETTKAAPGTVLRQSLEPGSRVRPGETVSLIYAVAPRESVVTSTRREVLPAPVQTSPEEGRTFDNYPRTTALRWEAVRGAASYTVELDCLHCCESGKWCSDLGRPWKIVRDIPVVRSPGYKFEFVGAQPGRWRVWAIDGKGREGEKSPWRMFRYTK